jgi:hypothetical protein
MFITKSFVGQPIAPGALRHNWQYCPKMSQMAVKAPLTLLRAGAYGNRRRANMERRR